MNNEQRLIRQAQAGSTAAFEKLAALHLPYVYNVALRTVANAAEAEDIAQETFVRVWKNLPKFRGDAQFQTWLYRIVTNLCYNRLPRLKKELAALDSDETLQFVAGSQSVEQAVISAELSPHLHAAIKQLPATYRLLISLRHLQGMSYAEIAATTELPLGTVKTGIFRARRDLRVLLLARNDN